MKDSRLLALAVIFLSFCAFAGAVDPDPYSDYDAQLPQLSETAGSLRIYVWNNGSWDAQGILTFDKFYREKQIVLSFEDTRDDLTRIKLVKEEGRSAHIDAVNFEARPATALYPTTAAGLAKLAAKDFDVLHAFDGPIELVFASPNQTGTLCITARIEPERISTLPFQLPFANMARTMTPTADFWSYKLDSFRGTLEDSLDIRTLGTGTPFFKEFLRSGSGHPSDYVHGWVLNDDRNLYVVMDLTGDNTMDGEKDYAKVYVKTPGGLRTFKVTQSENQWGEAFFVYTDKVAYQHKVYAFQIPFDTLGLRDLQDGTILPLAFGVYGTLSGPVFSKFFSPDTIGPGSVSTLTFIIDNTAGNTPVTDMAFTDTLPFGVTIATPANASTTCLLATISAPNGGGTITFSDGVLGGNETCTVSVDMTSSTFGVHTNTSGNLTSSTGNSGTATDDLTVTTTLPGFSKSFSPSSVSLGGRSTLTFTIDNTANASNVLNLDFTDNLPTGMVIAGPSNASTTCGTQVLPPLLTSVPGTSLITLDANGTGAFPAVAASATCTVTVDVIGNATGNLDNISGELLENFVSSGKASDTLTVTATAITLVKDFTDDPVPPGGTVTLEFTINNLDRNFPATSIAFTDLLPGGLSFTSGPIPDPPCGAGSSLTGTTTLTLAGGNLPPEGSCTFSATLTAGTTPGMFTNTTSSITGDVAGSPVTGDPASEIISIQPAPLLTKLFVGDPVNAGDDVTMRFTITNTSTTSAATDIAFVDELTTFLPYPVSVVLPGSACGGSIALIVPDTDKHALSLTGGSLTAAPGAGSSCTFDVTLTIPAGLANGTYLNTTDEITATVSAATVTGKTATDDLVVVAAPTLTKSFTDDTVSTSGGTVTLEFTLTHSANATADATGITFTDDLAPVLTGLTANLPPTPDPPCGTGSTLTGSAGDTFLTFAGGTLTPGQSCTFSVTLNAPSGAASGSHTNTTSGVTATIDGSSANSPAATDDLKVAGVTFTKEFIDDPVIPGDTVTLRFTIENVDPTDDATGMIFTDNLNDVLPGTPDITVSGALPTTPCGAGSSIIELFSGFLQFTGGNLDSGDPPCTFDVTLLVPAGAADDTFPNLTSGLSATLNGSGVTIAAARDELTVNSNLLQLTKSFTDDPAVAGGTVTLEFVITNLDTANGASSIAFTDDLGDALSGLTATSVGTNTCSFTIGGLTTDNLTLSDGTVSAGGTCTLSLTLTLPGTVLGTSFVNTIDGLTGTINTFAVTGDPASDTLEVDTLTFTKSFGGSLAAGGTQTLTFTITNLDTSSGVSGLAFSDDLNAVVSGLEAAAPLPTNPCGAGSTLAGTSFLTLTGGNLAASGVCSIPVTVTVPSDTAAGSFTNTTSDLSEFGLTVADPATATITIEPPPTFAKSFTPDAIGLGLTSTLTFDIDNSASALAAGSLAFTDTLPAGAVVATPPGATNSCGGTLTATAGTSLISLTGGTVGAGATCTISVDVEGTSLGALDNLTGDLTSTSGNSGTASDTLTVNSAPGFSKSFATSPITTGDTSTLTLTIDNSGSTSAATSLDFTDNLPAGVAVASPPGASNTCGGTLTASAGAGVISLAGGTVGAGTSCTVIVDVTGTAPGAHLNTTGDLTSSLGNSGTASDTLTVFDPPVTEFTGPTATGTGDATVSFTGDGLGCSLDAEFIPLVGHANSPPPGSAPPGVEFPHGLLTFTIGNACSPGFTASLTIVYPASLPPGTQNWKYGPTTGDPTDHWYTIPSSIVDDTVTFSVTDGGLGDDDLTANGTIIDPNGPAADRAVSEDAAIPTLDLWGIIILVGLLSAVAIWRLRV